MSKVFGWVFAALAAFSFVPANANASALYKTGSQPCWDQAAAYHKVDPWLLYAIAYVESRHNPSAVGKNKNGTYDIGLMQINTVHLPTLSKYGIPQSALKNACASTYIGAWVLSNNFRRFGNSWQAIAAYNVGSLNTPGRRATGYKYTQKVYAAYSKLVKQNQGRMHQANLAAAGARPEIYLAANASQPARK